MVEVERRMIAPGFVEEALDSLRRLGKPTAPILARVGLPAVVDQPVSAETYGALWLAIAAELDDEFFGMSGRPMRSGSFTLLCHCVLHAPTLGQALRRALRFLDVVLDDPRGRLVIREGLAEVELRDTGSPRSAFAYRTYWIILHGITCWLVGRRIPIRLVDFRCVEPKQGADYRLFFGAPVRFSQPISRLGFDSAMLDLPISRNEQALKQFLRGAPANILVRYRYDAGVAAAVRRRLGQATPVTWRSFAELAADMRMRPSTLRHRLHDEGQSYAAIKDDIRRDLAVELLLNTSKTIGEIAAQLGYSEPSAFFRAFRKWMGKSPEAFRREEAENSI
ncbi:AraC family transcriptional regulator [Rhizobium lentis]|uniref:AraC family transcriptional regulator n=1 Tax=Rhizobium TaxID=379 RepID=UPI001609E317|nr:MULTISPECIES: AraC family transcriptional regulator [Rhizobium]MBB3351488.1 AraC-like DNA-binding protein [Rhizobium sp. BK049]MBX5132789.1 AraC family transcriptional regulator [Rhizobium lentis]MBX5139564.1 AraC family transcriptional regulator [Rhizobium lentis]MBX5151617.1 AraC family transcriptional regulator [Rhizobium lentis]MBX5176809.1 AraC family transcriptional regulator [Rhizobium lentis]